MELISKKELDEIRNSIDFSKYAPKEVFKRRSDWALDQFNSEAVKNNQSYGEYSEDLYLKKKQRPIEALYVEAFLYNDNKDNLLEEISKIKYDYQNT